MLPAWRRPPPASPQPAAARPLPHGTGLTAPPAEEEDACSDEAALGEASRLLIGVAMHAHAPTMAIFLRTLLRELAEMQPEIDAAGWNWYHNYDADGEKISNRLVAARRGPG